MSATTAEEVALGLVRRTIEAPGSVTETLLIEAAMGSSDPTQHHLDITRALMRIVAALLNIAGKTPARALIILEAIEAEYRTGNP